MKEIRLGWEPESLASAELVSRQVMKYMDGSASFAQFECGTCLMLKRGLDSSHVIEGAMKEARSIIDFEVHSMNDGDYLVFFANPLLVYVGKEEFLNRSEEIRSRLGELHFPSESILPASQGSNETKMLVGIYARGKLQHDAWNSGAYRIVRP